MQQISQNVSQDTLSNSSSSSLPDTWAYNQTTQTFDPIIADKCFEKITNFFRMFSDKAATIIDLHIQNFYINEEIIAKNDLETFVLMIDAKTIETNDGQIDVLFSINFTMFDDLGEIIGKLNCSMDYLRMECSIFEFLMACLHELTP